MRTICNAFLVSALMLSTSAFASSGKKVAQGAPAATEQKPVDTKSSAPAVEAPKSHARKVVKKKTVKTEETKPVTKTEPKTVAPSDAPTK